MESCEQVLPPAPAEKGPLAPEITRPKPPLPIASPRLLLLLNLERPRALRSSAALSLAFCSSNRARLSRSASSRRTFLGRKRPAAGALVARVVVPPRPGVADILRGTGVALPEAAPVATGVEEGSALPSAVAREPAAAAPLRVPRAEALPRFISSV
ncbi:hypothetical protein HG530_007348 [Fusarium avenaceum]|nr:hypothetical protein HG530_007348 [Fusarium avenaceum]